MRDTWIQTFSGRKFWPLAPSAKDVLIKDIAHALSLTCRFTGHCSHFYSVAEHSILVADLMDESDYAIFGLMHDAAEAYLPDIAAPIKSHIQGFREIEDRVIEAIYRRYGLWERYTPEIEAMVKKADLIALATEAQQLLGNKPGSWHLPYPPNGNVKVGTMGPSEAEAAFKERFLTYM